MKRTSVRTGLAVLTILILALPALVACGGSNDSTSTPSVQPTALSPDESSSPLTSTPDSDKEDVKITIGNLSDLTGISSGAQYFINKALDDAVEYFNDQNLIPGVQVEVITYDGQFDPSRDIPGYEWLRERGADLIFTAVTSTPVILKPRVNEDHVPLFAASGSLETIEPPGYVFALASLPQHEALTLVSWIAEHDWDYETKGPAKIGGATWDEPNSHTFFDTVEQYASEHPDQFEWVGGKLAPFSTFTWGPEAEALKDCDYVFPALIMPTFVKEYRNVGGEASYIGTGAHAAMLGLIGDSELWDEIDGMLFARTARWWTETGAMIDLQRKLLSENHSDEAEEIIRNGSGYNTFPNLYMIVDIIRKAAEEVGPENLDSETIYQAAQSYELIIDGVKRYSFTETKRIGADTYAIYEANAAEEDLFRVDPEWYHPAQDN